MFGYIGADHYWNIITGDITRKGNGPVAISSKLGWLLSKPAKDQINKSSRIAIYLGLTELINAQDELTSQLQQFWDIEPIGISKEAALEDNEFSQINGFSPSFYLTAHRTDTVPHCCTWNLLYLHSINYEL